MPRAPASCKTADTTRSDRETLTCPFSSKTSWVQIPRQPWGQCSRRLYGLMRPVDVR